MTKGDRNFARYVFKMLFLLLGCIILCRFSMGAFLGALLLATLFYGGQKKMGHLLLIYFLIPFLTVVNPMILPKTGLFMILARLTAFTATGLMVLHGSTAKTRNGLPLGVLFLYVVIACMSSLTGWCPFVSYLKIANYLLFLTGLCVGSKAVSSKPEDIMMLRAAILAAAIFVVFGSLVTLAFPSVGYMNALKMAALGYSEGQIKDYMASDGFLGLLCGVTMHSQFLGPFLACVITWVLCDMCFSEGRITLLHGITFGAALPLLYMTRSRAALMSFMVGISMLVFYSVPRAAIIQNIRKKMQQVTLGLVMILVIAAAISEIRSGAMTRWLRKSDDRGDSRSLAEAVTASRQGAVAANMYDFNQNMLFGKGFQVSPEIGYRYKTQKVSMVFSAPIEKGLLPLMILGETGLIGALVFICFLVVFYTTAAKKKYYATIALFTTYLATNMAEASFFSPLGGGGVEWIVTVMGGYVLDLFMLERRRIDEFFRMQAVMQIDAHGAAYYRR